MATEGTTNEGWLFRQWNRLPLLVRLIMCASLVLDWKAIRDHGILWGLRDSLKELIDLLPYEIVPVIFVGSVFVAMHFAERLDSRKSGVKIGSWFGRLNHDWIANERG